MLMGNHNELSVQGSNAGSMSWKLTFHMVSPLAGSRSRALLLHDWDPIQHLHTTESVVP